MYRFMSVMASRSRRQFAPLKAESIASGNLPRLKGVVFDVDGTLCRPQNYMFGEMRAALDIPKQIDILEHVYALPTAEAREEAMESIRHIERTAMAHQEPQPGLVELMTYLDSRDIPKGICTRNFDAPVDHLLSKFLSEVKTFHPIVTREFRPPKPHPAGILHIARSWGLTSESAERGDRADTASSLDRGRIYIDAQGDKRSEEVVSGDRGNPDAAQGDASGLIMVGDSIDDMTAGRRSGAATVLLVNPANEHLAQHEHTDLAVTRLDDLIQILEEGFQGREV
ncbi:HAD-like domain-containing protein [Coniella lustricola]|uniref:HAD-like domain-containing protein n=1 Tax=Coniella lustricola TaxID=2025994 RepID=A0A2T3AB50_9PEZI|nr:HAD-like domain-containing protein [Coniella lustricola]